MRDDDSLRDRPETLIERLERECLQAQQAFGQVFTNNRQGRGNLRGKRALDSARAKWRRAQKRLARARGLASTKT